ncbi:hypothetical protein [Zavarzinella formosa]|uniref:hypothetical protein n=1 Tax=Zavarzinella formosa TaxID=360055 RepID=UPI000317B3A0|nr:hypothetical protein [Zavarzinella formosa]
MTEDVTINPEAVEPHEYFAVLKESVKGVDADMLQEQLAIIAEHLVRAKKVGQQSLLNQLAFTHDVIVREMKLLGAGISQFVYQDDVKHLLDKTKHIKIIELDRYPRVIPLDQMADIEKAKDIGLFDEFCVVFSDYTGEEYKTEEEKQTVARNRDPVVFGYFRHKNTGIKHDRFYFITDWEDEYCDLTFGKMIDRMAEVGISKPSHNIAPDAAYVQELVTMTLEDMANRGGVSFSITPSVTATQASFQSGNEGISFWERMKRWIGTK